MPRFVSIIAGLALLCLILVLFIQAPYRGAVKEIEDNEARYKKEIEDNEARYNKEKGAIAEAWKKDVAEIERVRGRDLLGREKELFEAKQKIEELQHENAKLKGGS